MTNATAQCEFCSKTKRFANATVNELNNKHYICEGCGAQLVMIKKTEFTLIGTPVAGLFMENSNAASSSSN